METRGWSDQLLVIPVKIGFEKRPLSYAKMWQHVVGHQPSPPGPLMWLGKVGDFAHSRKSVWRVADCFSLMRGSSLRARAPAPSAFFPKESWFTTNRWLSMWFPKQPSLPWIELLAVERTSIFWVPCDFLRKMTVKTACFPAGRMLSRIQFHKWPRLVQS